MLHLFVKNTVNHDVSLQIFFHLNIFSNVIIFVMAKLNFQQPLLQSSVSHDPSENMIWAQVHFLIIIIIIMENSSFFSRALDE